MYLLPRTHLKPHKEKEIHIADVSSFKKEWVRKSREEHILAQINLQMEDNPCSLHHMNIGNLPMLYTPVLGNIIEKC